MGNPPMSYTGVLVRVTLTDGDVDRERIITPRGSGLTTLGALKTRAEEIGTSWPSVDSAEATEYFDPDTRTWTSFPARVL